MKDLEHKIYIACKHPDCMNVAEYHIEYKDGIQVLPPVYTCTDHLLTYIIPTASNIVESRIYYEWRLENEQKAGLRDSWIQGFWKKLSR